MISGPSLETRSGHGLGLRFGMGLQEFAVVAFPRLPPAADDQRVGMHASDRDAQHFERRDPG